VAPRLLGATLISRIGGEETGGIIVETEAYREHEPASHSFRGPTDRNRSMFLEGGHLYVYFIYGMHFCLNVVCGRKDHGEAVLIRSIKPTIGIGTMRTRRGPRISDIDLANGPGKLTQALGIDRRVDGCDLDDPNAPVTIRTVPEEMLPAYTTSPRVGITKARDLHWRFQIDSAVDDASHPG
jgi:DNA-3-methyladenine glycosylase